MKITTPIYCPDCHRSISIEVEMLTAPPPWQRLRERGDWNLAMRREAEAKFQIEHAAKHEEEK